MVKHGCSLKIEWKSDLMLSSSGFQIIDKELDLMRFSKMAKKGFKKKTFSWFHSIRAVITLTVVESG